MIQDYLESQDIQYWEAGSKNVSKGWIGINCLFCDDHSNHLGINLTTAYFKCWLCEQRGSVVELIAEIERCGFARAKKIFKRIWESDSDYLPPSPVSVKRPSRVTLPPTLNRWPEKYLDFLASRNFNPKEVIRKYGLLPTSFAGEYRYRVLIPFYVNKAIVTFTARDITNRAEVAYKDAEISNSVIEPKNCIYNIDNMKSKNAVVVEGALDTWRIGDGAGSINGKQLSEKQAIALVEKNFEKLLFLLDADAIKKAKEHSFYLHGCLKEVFYGELDTGDPDTMNYHDLMQVKRFIESK